MRTRTSDTSLAPTVRGMSPRAAACGRHAALVACVLGIAVLACRPAAAPLPEPREIAAYAVVGDDSLHVYRYDAPAPFARADSTRVPRPAVLLLHGGGFTGGTAEDVSAEAAAFARAGYAAFAAEYRLSTGTRTPVEALVDACGALHWLRLQANSLGIDPTRLAVYGVEAGGYLAAATVTVGCPDGSDARGADALLLVSPWLDVARDSAFVRLLQGRVDAAVASPIAAGRAVMPPTVIIQGGADSVTPLAGAQRFCLLVVTVRAACDLRVYDGLGHRLTRDVAAQRTPWDPDPVATADAAAHLLRWLQRQWPIAAASAPGEREARPQD